MDHAVVSGRDVSESVLRGNRYRVRVACVAGRRCHSQAGRSCSRDGGPPPKLRRTRRVDRGHLLIPHGFERDAERVHSRIIGGELIAGRQVRPHICAGEADRSQVIRSGIAVSIKGCDGDRGGLARDARCLSNDVKLRSRPRLNRDTAGRIGQEWRSHTERPRPRCEQGGCIRDRVCSSIGEREGVRHGRRAWQSADSHGSLEVGDDIPGIIQCGNRQR